MKKTVANDTKKKVVIYCRTAAMSVTAKQENSLAQQERICREYSTKNGYEIAGTFCDVGSGISRHRKGLRELLRYCKNIDNEISGVVVKDLNRLSRNSAYFGFLVKYLHTHKIAIISATECHATLFLKSTGPDLKA